MKKILAHCGFQGYEHEEELYFEDEATSDEIYEAVHDWALQFLESWYEVA